MKPDYRYFPLFFAIAFIVVIQMFVTLEQQEDIREFKRAIEDFTYYTERLDLYNKTNGEKVTVNGVYNLDGDYYCVWAKEREPQNIATTEAHEYAHYLIDNGERRHFCEK